jgi:hypothetical protein
VILVGLLDDDHVHPRVTAFRGGTRLFLPWEPQADLGWIPLSTIKVGAVFQFARIAV